MQSTKNYSQCTCTYPREEGYLSIKRIRVQTYKYPRYIDLCATCQHCINCHGDSHEWNRQQGVTGLCTRGRKGRECAQPIIKEGMCSKHYHEKYNGQRPIKRHPLSISADERARRVQLSYEWTAAAKIMEVNLVDDASSDEDTLTYSSGEDAPGENMAAWSLSGSNDECSCVICTMLRL